ncbi:MULTISPECIES: DUF692 domain-containing protein [unclassified Streptomyces]|uniref:DUF692 domain-containing protein n=1 Tax=unclassified Streptomyces TaxID=2593676 RepID=UPI0038082C53
MEHAKLGTGIGWRPEIADTVEALAEAGRVDWVEAVAENVCPGHVPDSLVRLRERGVTVVPHGVSLGLGGAERPDPGRLAALAQRAEVLGAPLVTEHIAFVRGGGETTGSAPLEAGHLLPVPRTRDALDVLCENVRIAQEALPVPLALENIAALVAWPDEEMSEGAFLAELVERTGVRLLIDVANLHTNRVNRGEDPLAALDALPAGSIAYVHVAGGYEKDGVWHDSHAHPVPAAVLEVLAALYERACPPGVLLERDDDFPAGDELSAELAAVRAVVDAAARPADGARPALPVGVAPAARGARQRLALRQTALLSALVAGTPVPEGFDRVRVGVQSRALAAKRAGIVAKVAPELAEILGPAYRPAFLRYAAGRPLGGGYRRDALDFAAHLLDGADTAGAPDGATLRRLHVWWRERSGPAPLNGWQRRLLRHRSAIPRQPSRVFIRMRDTLRSKLP